MVDLADGASIDIQLPGNVASIDDVTGAPGPQGPPGASGAGILDSVVPGNLIDVDNTDPANPVVSVETLTLSGSFGVTATATELNYVDGVTSPIQAQIDAKAATADVADDIANAIDGLAGTAPGLLDTLGELADALGDDPNFAATMATALAGKQAGHANLSQVSGLSLVADRLPYANGAGTLSLTTLTAFIRTLLDDADAATARATLDAASRKLGGAEVKATASATTGATTLDCSTASVFSVVPTGNITAVNLTNVPAAGTACTITFIVNQGATPYTIATPTGGVFLGSATPLQVASKTCVFTYMTVDGGTTWYCSAAVQV